MAHLYVTIAVYGFIYGIITRLTRLHYQHGPAVISFYTFTSISVYILAWSHVAGNDPYARVWVHDAPLGVITAAVLSVFMWLGKTATRVTLYGWAHRHSAGSLRLELDLGPERARGAAPRARRAPPAPPPPPAPGPRRPQRARAARGGLTMHVPLTITTPSSALATIGALAGTATAIVGLISTIIVNQRKTATKLDAIHVLVNGNLSQVKDELKEALTRIEALQGNMEGVHETTDARHNVTDAQAHASVEMVHARTDSPRDTRDTQDTRLTADTDT